MAPVDTTLLGDGQVHVVAVVKNPAAIGARNQLLLRLAADHDLGRQTHMATAADAMLNSNHDGFALVANQSFIPGASACVARTTSFWAASACSISSISRFSILKISSLHISISCERARYSSFFRVCSC